MLMRLSLLFSMKLKEVAARHPWWKTQTFTFGVERLPVGEREKGHLLPKSVLFRDLGISIREDVSVSSVGRRDRWVSARMLKVTT